MSVLDIPSTRTGTLTLLPVRYCLTWLTFLSQVHLQARDDALQHANDTKAARKGPFAR